MAPIFWFFLTFLFSYIIIVSNFPLMFFYILPSIARLIFDSKPFTIHHNLLLFYKTGCLYANYSIFVRKWKYNLSSRNSNDKFVIWKIIWLLFQNQEKHNFWFPQLESEIGDKLSEFWEYNLSYMIYVCVTIMMYL